MEKPITIWLTGMPCSGKTTLANGLQRKLKGLGKFYITLDGDDLRSKINRDLGFSEKDRAENLRRVGAIANLFNEKGISVICSFVSPTEKLREKALNLIDNYKLIFVDCPAEECAKRDVKGMWKLAKEGKIKNFTGYSAPFEIPKKADVTINTKELNIDESLEKILNIKWSYVI